MAMKLRSPLAALALFQFMATVQYCTMGVLLLGIPCWFLSIHIKRKKLKKLIEKGCIAPASPSTLRRYTQIAVTIMAWIVWCFLLAVVIRFRLAPYSRPVF